MLQGCEIPLAPLVFVSKMLNRVSKGFDNLCNTFMIDSISEKNWGHERPVTFLEILHPCVAILLQIHWLSIINSMVLVFLLIGFVVIILVSCRKTTIINSNGLESHRCVLEQDTLSSA